MSLYTTKCKVKVQNFTSHSNFVYLKNERSLLSSLYPYSHKNFDNTLMRGKSYYSGVGISPSYHICTPIKLSTILQGDANRTILYRLIEFFTHMCCAFHAFPSSASNEKISLQYIYMDMQHRYMYIYIHTQLIYRSTRSRHMWHKYTTHTRTIDLNTEQLHKTHTRANIRLRTFKCKT